MEQERGMPDDRPPIGPFVGPLLLTMIPLEELLERLLKIVF